MRPTFIRRIPTATVCQLIAFLFPHLHPSLRSGNCSLHPKELSGGANLQGTSAELTNKTSSSNPKMSFHDLPPELLIEIAKCLDHEALARFSQTNRHLFTLTTTTLLNNSKSWVGRYGMTILHWAAENGRTALIQQLLERKIVDIENTEGRSWTALHYSAVSGQVETARILLDNGANPAAHDDYIYTPARIEGAVQPPPPLHLRPYRTPLHYAASRGHNDVVQLLVEHGVDINDFGKGDATPLQLATKNAHHETVRLLLELGADMKPAPGSPTPLHMAIYSGNHTIFEVLLEKSVDADIRSRHMGSTLLHIAVLKEELHVIIPTLLARGADANARNQENHTPLHLAALWKYANVVEHLLSNGADITAQDFSGATPLHWAAQSHCKTVIRILLQQGADATFEDHTGRTAVDWAETRYSSLETLADIILLLNGNTED